MSDFLKYLIQNTEYPNYKILNCTNLNLFYIEDWILKIDNDNNTIILMDSFNNNIQIFYISKYEDFKSLYLEINKEINKHNA